MTGLINWGTSNSGPTNDSELSGARINWGSTLTSQRKTNAAVDAQNRQVQQSRQVEQQQLQQQQKRSFLTRVLSPFKNFDKPPNPVQVNPQSVIDQVQHAKFGVLKNPANGKAFVKELNTAQKQSKPSIVQQASDVGDSLDSAVRKTFVQPVVRAPLEIAATIRNKSITPPKALAPVTGETIDPIQKKVEDQYKRDRTSSGAPNPKVNTQPFRKALAGPLAAAEAVFSAASDAAIVGGVAKDAVKSAQVIRAAAGKDQAVNDLLSTAKTNRVLKTAETKSGVGSTAITSAKTQARAGEAAIAGAKTEHVPVTDASVPTTGKPTLIDAPTYTKLSNQLSKAYDQESGALKDKGPVIQQKLQSEIDAKYQGLQDKLDESAGKTKVSFDEPKTPSAQPVATVKPTAPMTDVAGKPVAEAPVTGTSGVTPEAQPTETVKVPGEQLPVGTGTERTSTLEARMQGSLDNLTDEQKAGLSTYKQMNKKENISAAAMYVDQHPEEAMRVLRGEAAPPAGIAHNSVFLAMDAKGIDNPELARKLASLRSTRYGQEISLLTEANPHSPTSAMSNLRNIRIEAKGGETKVRARSTAIAKEIRTNTPKVTKDSWSNFVESLRC